jgi:DNA modification methylase
MNKEIKLIEIKISDIKPNPKNPKKHLVEKIEESIRAVGIVEPIVVDENNVILAGHGRLKALIQKGETKTKVIVKAGLTEKQKEKYLLLSNKLSEAGGWDTELLKEYDIELLLESGFSDEDLQSFFDDVDTLEDNFNIEKAVKEAKEIRVKSGEVWQLGDHKLMCGDSTKEENVKSLMGEDLADMIYCDPPYNIGFNYQTGRNEKSGKYKGKDYGGNYQDSKSDKEYELFIEKTIQNAKNVAKPNSHIFYYCDEKYIGTLQLIMRQNDIKTNRVCLWIKNNFTLTPQVAFNKVYEPCVYGTIGKPYLNRNMNNLNEIMNKEVGTGNQVHDDITEIINLWAIKRDPSVEYEHPTQKPVSLNEKPMKRCSAPGHIVLDLFGGSGSTLIAGQQLNRRVRMMEQDEVFATVILNRWEAFTNQKGKKVK